MTLSVNWAPGTVSDNYRNRRVKRILTSDDVDWQCWSGRQQCCGMGDPATAAEAATLVTTTTDEWLH